MLQDIVTKGSVDHSVELRIIDATDGTPETGVAYNTAGIDLWYRREGEARVAITEASLSALTDAHTDGGFLHISDGVYRLDLPDAAFAAGASHVSFGGTVTGMVVIGGKVRLVDFDLEDSVRMGLTALPNAAAGANGGLPLGNASGQVSLQEAEVRSAVGMASADLDTQLDAIGTKTANLPSDPADQSLVIAATTAIYDRLGAPAGASLAADVAAVKTDSAAILVDTGTDGVVVAAASKTGYRLSSAGVDDVLRTAMTEGYAADGAAFTLEQAMFMIWSLLAERSIASTTLTAKRLDGTTDAMTFTLDDATSPTSQTRAT